MLTAEIDIVVEDSHTNSRAPSIAAAEGNARLEVVLSITLRNPARHTVDETGIPGRVLLSLHRGAGLEQR